MSTSFLELLSKYSSTDNTIGTDKTTLHSYGELYNDLFSKMTPTNVLEIGTYSCAFLKVLGEYWPSSKVVGIDIDLTKQKYVGKFDLIQGDGTSSAFAKELFDKYSFFDIIIEDASHMKEHQLLSLEHFSKILNKNGVFVIEDINVEKYPSIKTEFESAAKLHGLSIEWHDLRHIKNRFDDVVAVFYKHS